MSNYFWIFLVAALIALLAYHNGYLEGRHDGWWSRDLEGSMYGIAVPDPFTKCSPWYATSSLACDKIIVRPHL